MADETDPMIRVQLVGGPGDGHRFTAPRGLMNCQFKPTAPLPEYPVEPGGPLLPADRSAVYFSAPHFGEEPECNDEGFTLWKFDGWA